MTLSPASLAAALTLTADLAATTLRALWRGARKD